MTPSEYGAALKGVSLTSPAYSALRGAGVGAALGAPVGAYSYATKDDASWKDAIAPSLAGAALGGTLGGVAQHALNRPVYQQYMDQMRDWEITRGVHIFQNAHAGAVQGGAAHPFSEASQQLTRMRDRRAKVVGDALTQAHGDRDVFKLKTHTGNTAAQSVGTKVAAEEEPQEQSFFRRHAGPLAGLAATAVAAPFIYKHLRQRRLSADPALRALQEQSGGKFTRVIEGRGAERGRIGKFVDRLVYGGGGDVRYKNDLRDAMRRGAKEKIEGTVMHDLPGEQLADGAVNLIANRDSDNVSSAFDYGNKLREYELFNHFAPGSMAKSESISNVLGELGHDLGHRDPSRHARQVDAFRQQMADNGARRGDMLEGLEGKLREKYPKGYLLKDVDASATGGKFPTDSHNLRDLAAGDGPAARTMVNAVKDPRSVMVQEKMPLEQGTWFDRQFAKVRDLPSTKEVRVHVMNGAVVPELTVPRFSPTMHVLDRDKLHGANDYARDLMTKLPDGLREGTFAMDVAPIVGGGYKLVESNPGYRSGFLSAGNNPLIGPQSHKAFTGQNSRMVSGIGAGFGAVGAGLGARAVANHLTEPAEPEKPKFTP